MSTPVEMEIPTGPLPVDDADEPLPPFFSSSPSPSSSAPPPPPSADVVSSSSTTTTTTNEPSSNNNNGLSSSSNNTTPTPTTSDEVEEEDDETESSSLLRPVWSSSITYGAAIMSVLMSQFWRGSTLVAKNNIWATLLALVLSFCVIGLPLLLLELGLAQRYQVGQVGLWQLPQLKTMGGRYQRQPGRFTGLGMAGLVIGLLTASISAGILNWTINAFVDSFWVHQDVATNRYWIDVIIGQQYDNDITSGRIVLDWNNVGYLLMVWTLVGTITSFGIRNMGRFLLGTTTCGLLVLLAIAIASLFVSSPETTEDSNNNYDDEEETEDFWTDFQHAIDQGDVLSESIIQSLYMIGLFVGIQSAYASYGSPPQPTACSGSSGRSTSGSREPTAKMACAAVGITLIMVMVVGYCVSVAIAKTSYLVDWHPLVRQNNFWNQTLSIIWVKWPASLTTLDVLGLGLGGGIHWLRLLYFVLIVLMIQFPIAVVTAFLVVLKDDRTYCAMARWKIAAMTSFIGFLVSLPFATSAGLVFLDTLDYYLTLTVLLVGFLESFAATWCYNLDEQVHHFGRLPIVLYVLWNFLPVVIAASVWFGFDNTPEDSSMNEIDSYHYQRMWIGLFGGIIVFLVFFACCFVAVKKSYHAYLERVCQRNGGSVNGSGSGADPSMLHPRDYYLEFCFGNVEALKRNIQPSLGQKLPQVWYIFLKRVVPHLLLLVFCKRLLMVESLAEDQFAFGHYGGYPSQPYQRVGMIVFGLVVGLIVLGLIYPSLYSPIVPPPTSIFINRRDTMEEEDLEEGTGEESSESTTSSADRHHHREPAIVPVVEDLPHMEDPMDIMDGIQRVDLN